MLFYRTIFYRRLNKKGTQEDQLKKAKKRVVSSTAISRGIAGLSIEELKAKKNETADKRKANRDATLRWVQKRSSLSRFVSVSGAYLMLSDL